MFNKDLETEIKDDTSGDFRKILVALLTANRPTGNMVDLTQADVDAQNLINAGIKKLGTDESRFIVILCSRRFFAFYSLLDVTKILINILVMHNLEPFSKHTRNELAVLYQAIFKANFLVTLKMCFYQ